MRVTPISVWRIVLLGRRLYPLGRIVGPRKSQGFKQWTEKKSRLPDSSPPSFPASECPKEVGESLLDVDVDDLSGDLADMISV